MYHLLIEFFSSSAVGASNGAKDAMELCTSGCKDFCTNNNAEIAQANSVLTEVKQRKNYMSKSGQGVFMFHLGFGNLYTSGLQAQGGNGFSCYITLLINFIVLEKVH
jgi:hypothetical protein